MNVPDNQSLGGKQLLKYIFTIFLTLGFVDVPIIAAALNYRLPVIPTNTPQLLTNINKNITTYPGSHLGR